MYLKVEGTSGDTILMTRTDREENKTFTIKVSKKIPFYIFLMNYLGD